MIHTLLLDTQLGATTEDRAKLLATGGLKIYTTLAPQDESAATNAVNYVVPANSNDYNPAQNVDTDVLMQPGTGKVLAIAEDRPYGTGPGPDRGRLRGQHAVRRRRACRPDRRPSCSPCITALEQGVPFGFQLTVPGSQTVSRLHQLRGRAGRLADGQAGVFPVTNSEGAGTRARTPCTPGRPTSINVFYAHLEQKVGLCNVVHTAVALGMTRADGTSLLKQDVTEQGGKKVTRLSRQHPLLHARLGQRLADVDGRGVRDRGLGRHLLRADVDHQDHRRRR